MLSYTKSFFGEQKISRSVIFFTAVLVALIYAGCFVIKSVTQVSSAQGNQQITSTLHVDVEGMVDANPHYGIVGLLVPNDWTVDSVKFSGGYTDICSFLHPDSSDKEPGGQVDFWADSLEGRYPSGANMQWVVYQSLTSHAVINDTVDVTLTIKMTTGLSQGSFNIGYFVTDAALDFSDPAYYSVSLNNAITISGVLPVELTSFNASAEKNGVNLKWGTATETNNKGFEIQRSSDRNNFITIGFVEGKGTASKQNNYSFTDKNLAAGTYSYRLKQVDLDGSFEYSKTVEVNYTVPEEYALMQNYPNPFNPSTSIQFGVPVDAKVMITIYNSVGEKISVVTNSNYTAGKHTLNLNGINLASGTYIYTISAEGIDGSKFVQSHKMVLLK